MRASVIGATGYAGVELLRLLDGHPEAEIATITSESSTGEAGLLVSRSRNPPGAAYAAPPSFAQGGHIGSLYQRELTAQQPEGLVNPSATKEK